MSNKHTIKIILFLFIFSHQFTNASEDIQQLKFINKQLQLQIEFHLQQQIFNNLEQEKLKLKQIELQEKVVELNQLKTGNQQLQIQVEQLQQQLQEKTQELLEKEQNLKEANEKIEKLEGELKEKDEDYQHLYSEAQMAVNQANNNIKYLNKRVDLAIQSFEQIKQLVEQGTIPTVNEFNKMVDEFNNYKQNLQQQK